MVKALLADLDIRVQAVVEEEGRRTTLTILAYSSIWLQAKHTKILENFTK